MNYSGFALCIGEKHFSNPKFFITKEKNHIFWWSFILFLLFMNLCLHRPMREVWNIFHKHFPRINWFNSIFRQSVISFVNMRNMINDWCWTQVLRLIRIKKLRISVRSCPSKKLATQIHQILFVSLKSIGYQNYLFLFCPLKIIRFYYKFLLAIAWDFLLPYTNLGYPSDSFVIISQSR